MFFNEEFIEWVEENPVEGIVKAAEMALEKHSEIEDQTDWTEHEHELLWDASSFISLVIEAQAIVIEPRLPDVTEDIPVNCSALMTYINDVIEALKGHVTKLKIDSYKNRYRTSLKKTFAYEFSQGDLDRVQRLINEIREQITSNQLLEENHKSRLLKRVEKLQMELHKRVSDLDRFWGLVGDAGVVLGKLGTDAKPIVDRIKEIAEITWKTQARTEELPSGTQNPVLEHGEKE